MKKTKTIKSEHVVLDTITCTEFIKELFHVHDLADQYSPGIHSYGPQIQNFMDRIPICSSIPAVNIF